MGTGGVQALQNYYHFRVIRYIHVLRKRCRDLNEHYAKLLVPKSPSPIDKTNKWVFFISLYFIVVLLKVLVFCHLIYLNQL